MYMLIWLGIVEVWELYTCPLTDKVHGKMRAALKSLAELQSHI